MAFKLISHVFGRACDLRKLLIQERKFYATQEFCATLLEGLLSGERGPQELGHGSVRFGKNTALELGLLFKQSLTCDFPKLGVLHFTTLKWILGWGRSAELSIFILYKAGATLLQLFFSWVYILSDLQKKRWNCYSNCN